MKTTRKIITSFLTQPHHFLPKRNKKKEMTKKTDDNPKIPNYEEKKFTTNKTSYICEKFLIPFFPQLYKKGTT